MKPNDGAHGVDVATTRFDEFIFSEKEPIRRLDEYDINFEDAREFFNGRWLDIVTTATERLTPSGS
jgi:hypothetical protein